MNAPVNFEDMVVKMLQCEQAPGLSVYLHGQQVWDRLRQLLDYLKHGGELPDWKLPKWLVEYREQLSQCLYDDTILNLYILYHDCGKPFCLEVDEAGKAHFPNHAEVSSYVWQSVGGDPIVGSLIRDDMVIHTASADEIRHFTLNVWNREKSVSLLLTALAEVHANGKMFGGFGSTSFLSKLKTVERRGNQMCKLLFELSGQTGPTGKLLTTLKTTGELSTTLADD
jgi:hypothetical protein